jgi:hypothetical protein
MWDLFTNSLKLFVRGKLFREPAAVFRQWLIGFASAAAIVVLLVKIGAALWLAVVAAAIVSGGLQPFLFKNLKYA